MGPVFAQINHAKLRHNFNLIRNAVGSRKVMAVVKANAYGHGMVETAKTLLYSGADFLGVAFTEEGVELRRASVQAPILVFGAILPDGFPTLLNNRLDITITQKSQLQTLAVQAQKLNIHPRVHLKFDSGMHRVGLFFDELLECVRFIQKQKTIELTGIYSHLSSADDEDTGYTLEQINKFSHLKKSVEAIYTEPLLYHLANSAAIMRYPRAWFDMVRPGIILYGNPPSPGYPLDWPLQEVMSLHSRVGLVKNVPAGSALSYGRRFTTHQTTQIAIIPGGYADGINRLLTNCGPVLIRGKKHIISGTVCMDQIVVDLGQESNVKVGDEALFFGEQGSGKISISEISRLAQTIPYETTCQISQRVERRHIHQPLTLQGK